MASNTLDKLFGSRIRIKLLRFLFRNYPGNFVATELAKRVQELPEEINKELKLLAELGLIKRNKHVK